MYKILNVKSLQFELVGNSLYYYKYNHVRNHWYEKNGLMFNIKSKSKEYIDKKLRDNIAPPIIIITIGHEDDNNEKGYWYMRQYKIPVNDNNKDLLTQNDTIMYNGYEYELDSIVLTNNNINIKEQSHSIAGISCDNHRYVFNGWTRYSTDPAFASKKHKNMQKIPCELMKFDWDAKKTNDFCINTSKCALTPTKIKDKKTIHCFSFNKGERSLVYVKKEYNIINTTKDIPDYVSYDKNSIKPVEKKECPDGKIINPLTGRCIKIKTAIDKNLVKPIENKICPGGKIINPLTGRCIKIKLQKYNNILQIPHTT